MAKRRKPDPPPYDRRLAQRMLDDALRASRTLIAFRMGSRSIADRMLAAREISSATERRLGRLARSFMNNLDGDVPTRADLASFSAEARRVIASAHLAAVRVYAGRTPTDRDRDRLDAQVRTQLAYLDGFMKRSRGEPVGPRFVATARLYGAATWTVSQNIRRDSLMDREDVMERGFLSISEHCPSCIDRAELGWQPIGTLKPLGDSECRVRCQCYFLFRRGDSVFDAEEPDL